MTFYFQFMNQLFIKKINPVYVDDTWPVQRRCYLSQLVQCCDRSVATLTVHAFKNIKISMRMVNRSITLFIQEYTLNYVEPCLRN